MLDTAPNNASNRSLRLLGRAKQAIKQAPGYDCFWPVVACRDRQQWLFSASMPVKSNANDWSGRMQVGGSSAVHLLHTHSQLATGKPWIRGHLTTPRDRERARLWVMVAAPTVSVHIAGAARHRLRSNAHSGRSKRSRPSGD